MCINCHTQDAVVGLVALVDLLYDAISRQVDDDGGCEAIGYRDGTAADLDGSWMIAGALEKKSQSVSESVSTTVLLNLTFELTYRAKAPDLDKQHVCVDWWQE